MGHFIQGCQQVVFVNRQMNQILIKKPDSGEDPRTFTFDAVYGDDCKQSDIFNESAFPLVESVIEGYNGKSLNSIGTIFAYG